MPVALAIVLGVGLLGALAAWLGDLLARPALAKPDPAVIAAFLASRPARRR